MKEAADDAEYRRTKASRFGVRVSLFRPDPAETEDTE